MKVLSNEMPKVSVVVPIFNVAPYIEDCAESLFKQTLSNIEYIFIDDASTDNSIEILKKIIDRYPERKNYIKIISHESNKGISFTREEGVKLATADWIIHCDSDDTIQPEMYETLLKETVKGFDIIICSYTFFDEKSFKIYSNQEFGEFYGWEGISLLSEVNKRSLHGALWNKLIRKELYEGIDFPKDISYWEDVVVLLKIFSRHPNLRIQTLALPLYNYRRRPNSLISQKEEKRKEELVNLIAILEEIRNKYEYDYSKNIDSRIVTIIYKLLLLTRAPKYISTNYKKYKKSIKINKSLNYFKKIHLMSALNGNFFMSNLIGFLNYFGKYSLNKLNTMFK
ncbi:MAG: glycosyltransferase [Muribaculaceae bacterium]|nr:glycosyltransferase [Muribaculaceae bacterium]